MKHSRRNNCPIITLALTFVLSITFSERIFAKVETVKLTITGNALPKPVEITDKSILTELNIWSGPGNFRIENGVKTPIVHDDSILWSQGTVPEPPDGLPRYEVSFYGPEERIIYVLIYEYDPTAKKGYVYLPGKGEKWYDVNVRSIYRGVEGHWFRASEGFDRLVESAIGAGTSAPAK